MTSARLITKLWDCIKFEQGQFQCVASRCNTRDTRKGQREGSDDELTLDRSGLQTNASLGDLAACSSETGK